MWTNLNRWMWQNKALLLFIAVFTAVAIYGLERMTTTEGAIKVTIVHQEEMKRNIEQKPVDIKSTKKERIDKPIKDNEQVFDLDALVGLSIRYPTNDGQPDNEYNKKRQKIIWELIDSLVWFQRNQAETITTHGKISTASALITETGKIQYQTEDGKIWRVTADKIQNGYKYGTPNEITENKK